MKRIIALILSLCLIVSFAGCRKEAEKTSSEAEKTPSKITETSENSGVTDDAASEDADLSSSQSGAEVSSVSGESSNKTSVSSEKASTVSLEKKETAKSNEYTITFDFGYDGKVVKVQTVNHDIIKAAPDVPDRPGYKFEAWFCGDTQLTTANKTANSDMTFVGRWHPIIYRMHYNFDPEGLLAAKGIYITGQPIPYDTGKTNWGIINSPIPQDIPMRLYYIGFPSTYDAESETITIAPIDTEKSNYSDRKYSNDDVFGSLTEFEFIGWTYGDITTPQKSVVIPKGSIGNYEFVAHWRPL